MSQRRFTSPSLRGAVLLVVLFLPSCTVATITTANVTEGMAASHTSHRFLWGLVGGDVNTSYNQIARIHVYSGLGDYLARLFTAGRFWVAGSAGCRC